MQSVCVHARSLQQTSSYVEGKHRRACRSTAVDSSARTEFLPVCRVLILISDLSPALPGGSVPERNVKERKW